MQIVKKITDISEEKIGFTIGNFDGVHLGHQFIIKKILDSCKKDGLKMAAMTFVPHPKEILGGKRHFLLNSYEDKRGFLRELGVDYLVELKFHRDFSTMDPGLFLDNEVFSNSKIQKFFLGHDFAFGRDKCADRELVLNRCRELGIAPEILEQFKLDGRPVSSSAIRKLLGSGKMEEASELLGRNFFLKGNIVKGKMRGRQLGFPTANMNVAEKMLLPENGVYITKTEHDSREYWSVTNIGHNPTFKDGDRENDKTIEVHILNFDKDIYGETIKTSFIKRIRDELVFKNKDDLVAQINDDIKYLSGYISQ